MRLIDAEAFVKELKKFLITIHQTYLAEAVLRMVQKVIDKQPTIEAKPVVHAHWTEENTDCWHCSDCLHPVLLNGAEEYVFLNYCPFCGAQMDEEVSDDKL